jgi:hypothetical protein
MLAMNPQDMSHIVDKIRASGCLTDKEFQRQVTILNGWETLLRIDQWDRWWEAELKKHVCRAAKLGKRHLPTISDSVVLFVFGIISAGYGLFIFSQKNNGIEINHLELTFAYGLQVVACLLLFQAGRSFWSMRKYKPALQMYEAGRRSELERLAGEHRPGARICLKCLKYTE